MHLSVCMWHVLRYVCGGSCGVTCAALWLWCDMWLWHVLHYVCGATCGATCGALCVGVTCDMCCDMLCVCVCAARRVRCVFSTCCEMCECIVRVTVCAFKTSPCVPSKDADVACRHAVKTRRRFERTHGDADKDDMKPHHPSPHSILPSTPPTLRHMSLHNTKGCNRITGAHRTDLPRGPEWGPECVRLIPGPCSDPWTLFKRGLSRWSDLFRAWRENKKKAFFTSVRYVGEALVGWFSCKKKSCSSKCWIVLFVLVR